MKAVPNYAPSLCAGVAGRVESVHRIADEVVRGDAGDVASECGIISSRCSSYLVECLKCQAVGRAQCKTVRWSDKNFEVRRCK
jgi:hypothetical protein